MRDELWLKHDARSRLDPKMSLFLKCEGMVGYGVFWALIEILHYQNNHELDLNIELGGIAAQLNVEELQLQNIVQRLVQYGLLLQEGNKVWQKRLKVDQAERSKTKQDILLQKKEAARLGGIKSGEARREAKNKQNESNSTETLEESKQNEAGASKHEANELDKRDKRDKRDNNNLVMSNDTPLPKKRTKGEKYRNFELGDFKFPRLWGEQAKAALERWVKYKDEKGCPKLLTSYQEEVDLYSDRPKVFYELVSRAISSSWEGLNAQIPLGKQEFNQERKSQGKINQENSISAVESILRKQGYET